MVLIPVLAVVAPRRGVAGQFVVGVTGVVVVARRCAPAPALRKLFAFDSDSGGSSMGVIVMFPPALLAVSGRGGDRPADFDST